jgi:hypothetical protein
VQEETAAVTIQYLSKENQVHEEIAAVTVLEQREPGAGRDSCSSILK